MTIRRPLLLLFLLSLGLFSCKKDLLHWQSATQLNSSTNHRLSRILFVNDSLGFIVGGERFSNANILTTHDGGNSWQLDSFPAVNKGLYGVAAGKDGNIYAIGYEGKMLNSKDYGRRWQIAPQRFEPYKAMAVGATGNLLMIGGISFDYGFIDRADGDGNQQSSDSLNYELNDINMLANGTGYISAFGAALKTTDNGATWQRQEVGKDNFKGLYTVSATEVWTCGYNGSIYHTTDGGNSWDRKRNGNDLTIPRYNLESLLFTDALNGYAVGEQGVVIYTDDGGDHWSEFDRFTSETLHSIALCADGSLVVCGENGTLYKLQKK